jgi:hypothetical protein
MERSAELIEKLKEEYHNNVSPEQMLVTLQLLQKELTSKIVPSSFKKGSKVSVVMPNSFQTNIFEAPEVEEPVPEITIKTESIPVLIETPPPVETPKVEEIRKEEAIKFEDLPIIAQQNTGYELNEKVAQNGVELNEKFTKEEKHSFVEVPLKDLKKGIGLNDKFLFMTELFRNDEAMYDRSIKTINGFNIYQEAQFWMERELKIKLGWDDEQEATQHFYDLVKRRFAVT